MFASRLQTWSRQFERMQTGEQDEGCEKTEIYFGIHAFILRHIGVAGCADLQKTRAGFSVGDELLHSDPENRPFPGMSYGWRGHVSGAVEVHCSFGDTTYINRARTDAYSGSISDIRVLYVKKLTRHERVGV